MTQGIPIPSQNFTPSVMETLAVHLLFVTSPPQAPTVQDPMQAMRAQVNDMKKLIISSSKHLVYIPSNVRRGDDHDTGSLDVEVDDEQTNRVVQTRGKVLTTADIYRACQDFLACLSSVYQNLMVSPMEMF